MTSSSIVRPRAFDRSIDPAALDPRPAPVSGEADERWSVVPEATAYRVSDLGRVAVTATGRVLWHVRGTQGFCTVRAATAAGRRLLLVHLLVAVAFVRNPYAHQEVRHLDGVLTHNRAANLAWGSLSDRDNDAVRAAWFVRIAAADALGPEARGLLEPWERMRAVTIDLQAYRPSLADPWPRSI